MPRSSFLACKSQRAPARERLELSSARQLSSLMRFFRIALVMTLLVCETGSRAFGANPSTDPLPVAREQTVNEPHDEDNVKDEDPEFALGADVDVNARYLWRGLALSNGTVMQPSGWMTAYGLNAVLWTNVMLTDEGSRRLSAIVPSLTYTFQWRSLTVEPGVIYYDSPGQPLTPSTGEASLEASIELGWLHLLTSDYVDVVHAPGAYFGTAGAWWEPKVGHWSFKAQADLGVATAAYNRVYFDADVAALDLAEVGASARVDLTDVFYAAAHSEVSVLVPDAL